MPTKTFVAMALGLILFPSAVGLAQGFNAQNPGVQTLGAQSPDLLAPTLGDIARKNRERKIEAARMEAASPATSPTPAPAANSSSPSTRVSARVPVPTPNGVAATLPAHSEVIAAAEARVEDLLERELRLQQNLARFEREALAETSAGDEAVRRSFGEAMEITRTDLATTTKLRGDAEKALEKARATPPAPKPNRGR